MNQQAPPPPLHPDPCIACEERDVQDEVHAAVAHLEQIDHDCWQLLKTSLLIGLALTLHNLPEGLATFVG